MTRNNENEQQNLVPTTCFDSDPIVMLCYAVIYSGSYNESKIRNYCTCTYHFGLQCFFQCSTKCSMIKMHPVILKIISQHIVKSALLKCLLKWTYSGSSLTWTPKMWAHPSNLLTGSYYCAFHFSCPDSKSPERVFLLFWMSCVNSINGAKWFRPPPISPALDNWCEMHNINTDQIRVGQWAWQLNNA